MIKPPTEPEFPCQPNFTRHQFILAIDGKTREEKSELEISDYLLDFFGGVNIFMIEKVREDKDWHIFHLWLDIDNSSYD